MKINRNTIFYFLLSISLLFGSCASISKMQLKSLSDVKVSGISEKKPEIKFNLKLYNPAPVGVKVKSMDITLSINGTNITTLSTTDKVKIKKKSEFVLPLSVAPAWNDVADLLKAGVLILITQKFNVGLSGTVVVKKFIFKKTLSFNLNTDKISF